MGKRQSSGTWVLFLLIGAVVLIAMIPIEVWITIGVVAAIGFGIHFYSKSKAPPPPSIGGNEPTLAELTATRSTSSAPGKRSPGKVAAPTRQGGTAPVQRAQSTTTDFYSATLSNEVASGHAIPAAPVGIGKARWFPSGYAADVAGVSIPGGLIYVGTELPAPRGGDDPCLINPRLKLAPHGDYSVRQTDYWPRYADISGGARRSYLNWLAGGRMDPRCDVGFVFLFFYGLERRILVDSPRDPAARQDWPAIASELRRLISIYGGNGSFRRYAHALLDWMQIPESPQCVYKSSPPPFPPSGELPLLLRLALGQTARDRAPVPADWALAWIRAHPGINLRTAAKRCPEEFDRLFVERYHEILGTGLVLPKNRTKLKAVYQPASSGLIGLPGLTHAFSDIPDATGLIAPLRPLQEIVDTCSEDLGSFSRFVGKNPSARTSLDGLLQLPVSLWPTDAKSRLQQLLARMQDGLLVIPLSEVAASLGSSAFAFTREKIRSLTRTFEGYGIGVEPNVLSGARPPSPEENVVLFTMSEGDGVHSDNSAYQAAAVTLQLATVVAQADGEFNSREAQHLRLEIQRWNHLTPAHQRRLNAHLQWLIASPISLAGLKGKVEPLSQSAREVVATFLATLARADGEVSPAEVKFLQKVYRTLGVDPGKVFTDLHGSNPQAAATTPTGFKLDPERLAQLQQDTEKVTALLAGIFRDEEVPPAQHGTEITDEPLVASGLLGLDAQHTALAQLLISRPQWSRSELEDAAADADLMLDGALERLNEAAFDTHEIAFTEGEDPIGINPELLEKIAA